MTSNILKPFVQLYKKTTVRNLERNSRQTIMEMEQYSTYPYGNISIDGSSVIK